MTDVIAFAWNRRFSYYRGQEKHEMIRDEEERAEHTRARLEKINFFGQLPLPSHGSHEHMGTRRHVFVRSDLEDRMCTRDRYPTCWKDYRKSKWRRMKCRAILPHEMTSRNAAALSL